MTTTAITALVATLLTLQGVKSYNDAQEPTTEPTTIVEPAPFALSESELSSLHSQVTGVAAGIRNWETMKVETAEYVGASYAPEARQQLEAGIERQSAWIELFTAVLTALGLK